MLTIWERNQMTAARAKTRLEAMTATPEGRKELLETVAQHNPLLGSLLNASPTNEFCFEAVSWRDYRRGPAKRWDERPWEAFRFCVQREDENETFDAALIGTQYDEKDPTTRGQSKNDILGWEVWCKKKREVIFVDDDGTILKRIPDPLELTNFFSTATPVQPIEVTGRLMPVNPFSVYRKLADELDLTTKRINVITNQMKVAGWYPGSAKELENMLSAQDVDFIPIADHEIWAANGGLAGAVAFWPIEKFILVLKELYASREQTKQAIYEITGISDIVRGATKATETLGAQQIKTQWGSLRIQKMQRMMERTARDLFVMMSEIIPSKFSFETLQTMTGVQILPNQQDMMPPTTPEEEQAKRAKLAKLQGIQTLLGQRLQTFYRIDVESDSTVKADLTRQKAEAAEFMQGAGAYLSAVGPMVKEGSMPADAAAEIFAANARLFNLGKSVEDTLERVVADAKAKAAQPPQPSPEQQAAQAEAAARQQEAQAKAADRAADAQAKQQEAAGKAQERADNMAMKRAEHDQKITEGRQQMVMRQQEHDLKMKEMGAQAALVGQKAEANSKSAAQEAAAPLEKAIQIHEGHMNGTVPTSDQSQMEMMTLMQEALAELRGDTAPAMQNMA